VISLDSFNRNMPVVVIAAMTHTVRPGSRIQVHLPAGQPMRDEGAILGFQVATIDQVRLGRYEGTLTKNQLQQLNEVISRCFGLAP
jgi:mRNA-degrading endonuclease toxin of MazEF toxin-antitoxin module